MLHYLLLLGITSIICALIFPKFRDMDRSDVDKVNSIKTGKSKVHTSSAVGVWDPENAEKLVALEGENDGLKKQVADLTKELADLKAKYKSIS